MMLKIYRFSLSVCSLLVAMAAFAVPAPGQTDAGSFEELLDLDLAPLETSDAPLPGLPYLAEPEELRVAPAAPSFSIGPLEEAAQQTVPPLAIPSQVEPRSVLEVPHIALDPLESEELVLPDLSVPTPENTRADIAPVLPPRLHAPQPLTYARNVPTAPDSSFDRFRLRSIPLQIQFYSVRQVNPAFTYGAGARPSPYSYRGSGYLPYGGYQPYGGYGGYRDSLGPRPPRGLGCSGRR